MAWRGRGRGRGRFGGGGGFGYIKQEPFVEFPEIELPDRKGVKEERALVVGNAKLQNFWKSSAYYLEETVSKSECEKLVSFIVDILFGFNEFKSVIHSRIYEFMDSQSVDIERFSDWGKSKSTSKRDKLNNFLQLTSVHFPAELVQGVKTEQRNAKKVRWNPDSDLKKFDLFEKLEQKYQGREEKDEKEKKEGEDDEEDEDEEVDEAEEEFSDDDYLQNVDFDDDEDDYNNDDGNDDEPVY